QKFMTEAPKEDRDAFVSKFTSVRPELVAEMSLPIFVSDFNVPSLKTNMELAVGQKLIESIAVDSMVGKGQAAHLPMSRETLDSVWSASGIRLIGDGVPAGDVMAGQGGLDPLDQWFPYWA